jgi:hypothetical protein
MKLVQRREGRVGVVQHHRFGDLQFQPVGRQTGFVQCVCNRGNQVPAFELRQREIDGDPHLAWPGAIAADA